MVTIAIRFTAGRFHATPWGSHVNEGRVEWPPNPWRLLRALIATGFHRLGWSQVPDEARALIEKLAAVLPDYHLPRGEVAHTRHYMPNGSFHSKQKNLEATDKVLDTFVRVRPDSVLLIRFPVELDDPELSLLERLLDGLSYFGRAESWCEAFLWRDVVPEDGWTCCVENSQSNSDGGDQVALLAAQPTNEYTRWREMHLQKAMKVEEARRGKQLTPTQRKKVTATLPEDLIGCLTVQTSELQKQGWNQPPGSRNVLYLRPAGVLEPRPIVRRRGHGQRTYEAALLALSSDSVRGNRLPRMVRTVRQMEFIHQAVCGIVRKLPGGADCSVLTGKDSDGRPLRTAHQHAHFFPLDLDRDQRIDHVLIYAPGGLDPVAQRAITRLRRTWTKDKHDVEIFVTCAGFGDLDLFRRQLTDANGHPLAIIPREPTRHWTSYTPYVPARFLKPRNGRYTLHDDVRRELSVRGLPEAVEVHSLLELEKDGKHELVDRQFFQFVRCRQKRKPQPPQPAVFGIRLELAEPVAGPIALGYASHFGLGLFAAMDSA